MIPFTWSALYVMAGDLQCRIQNACETVQLINWEIFKIYVVLPRGDTKFAFEIEDIYAEHRF